MTKPDTTTEMQIGRDWTKSLALTAILICLLFVWAYGTTIEPHDLYDRRFRDASILMLPIFSVLSVVTLVSLVKPWGAPVRISPSGFFDLRAGSRIVPWDEISNVVRRGDYVTLTLKRRFGKTYRMSLTQKALKASRKSAGPNHLLIADWCLETNPHQLFDIVTAYRDECSAPPAP